MTIEEAYEYQSKDTQRFIDLLHGSDDERAQAVEEARERMINAGIIRPDGTIEDRYKVA